MDEKFIEKLRKFFENQNVTQKRIAEDLSVSPTYVNKLMTGQKGFGKKTAQQFHDLYGLSVSWLITGEGDMLNAPPPAADVRGKRPRIVNYANAGPPTENMPQGIDDYCPVVEQLPDYDCSIVIHGDSMLPTFHSGDEIAVKDITRSGFRQWGEPHVLNTSQGILIKRIYPDEANKGYRCVSDNKEYEPFVIPESEVYNVYKVVGFIRALAM